MATETLWSCSRVPDHNSGTAQWTRIKSLFNLKD